MSLSTRLDKLEAAMRGRDGRDPPDGPWICRRLIYDPSEWQIEEEEAISRMKTDELDRLVAAGMIREIDREHVRFIVRRSCKPPHTPDLGVPVRQQIERQQDQPNPIAFELPDGTKGKVWLASNRDGNKIIGDDRLWRVNVEELLQQKERRPKPPPAANRQGVTSAHHCRWS